MICLRNYLWRLSCDVLVRVWDLSACNKAVLLVHIIVVSSLCLQIAVPVQLRVRQSEWWCSQAVTCSAAVEMAHLQHCGSLPLRGSALMIDKVDPSQVVLPLLPTRGQRRQLQALSATWQVLSLQKLPTWLHNRKENTGDYIMHTLTRTWQQEGNSQTRMGSHEMN